jgi:glutathionyl-hydroquinone reductase
MGVLVDGKWIDGELPQETSRSGAFERADSVFRDRITADGSSGVKAEPGRYHLYVAHGCPWAHRTLIYRALKKLESMISVAYAVPGLKQNGWTFERDGHYPDCIPDEVNGFHYLYEAYLASNPSYTGKVTVPTLWDKKTKRIVNNESSEIIRMFNTEFNAITGDRTDFYPPALRAEIDAVNERVYRNVNNGVYRAGFARTQSAYDQAMTGYLKRSTGWRRGCRDSAIWSAGRSPRPTGGCFRRSCASTSPTSRCSNATANASPTTRTYRITCASSIRCPASPPR